MLAATPSASRPRRRRALFALVGLTLVWLVVEVAGVVAWWAMTGAPFTFGAAAALRATAVGEQDAAAEPEQRVQQQTLEPVVVHPYFGYVYDHDAAPEVSSYGFVGAGAPLHARDPRRFVVGLAGGSVALQLGSYAGDELVAALQQSPALQGRQVEIVRLGIGGYKQPQQLSVVATLFALGGHFDCIVNLDGFNEIALPDENVPYGVPAWFPRSWARMMDAQPSAEQLLRLGRLALLREQRREVAATAGWCAFSPLCQTLWLWRDRRLARAAGELAVAIERADGRRGFVVTGPGAGDGSIEHARGEAVEIWRRASLELQALCAAHGALYVHLLQPNQYVPGSKPMGELERARAIDPESRWGEAVARWYPELLAAGERLRAEGVAFTELTGIFADHPEPLWFDRCCHLSSAGNRLLARHVAAAVRRQLELRDVQFTALRVEPTELVLDSPFATVPLRVTAVDREGRAHDLSGSGLGVKWHATPADGVFWLPDGAVGARVRGEFRLQATLGELTADVALHAAWAATVVGDDGFAAADRSMPRLAIESVPEAARVRLVERSPAPLWLLVTGPRPLPASPVRAETEGLMVFPLAGDGDPVTTLPLLPSGQPLFVRAYALDHDAVTVLAATPTVVLTRD